MINESVKDIIKKLSYYCQSCYTSMHLFNDLVENRKLEVLNDLLMKIIEDITNLMKFYSELNLSVSVISNINNKLELVMDGYTNSDYFYIKDIFEYEILPIIEDIFNEVKKIVFNENN